jgi:hypothetical protein
MSASASRWPSPNWFGAVSLVLTLSFWVVARFPDWLGAVFSHLSIFTPLTWVCLWFAAAIAIGTVAALRGSLWWIVAPGFALLSALVFIGRVVM